MYRVARVFDKYRVRRRVSRLIAAEAIVVDTETTDLDGYVVEIAGIDLASGEVVFQTLVNPGVPIAAEAHAVHGIGECDVRGAPSWREVEEQVTHELRGRPVVAYNAAYDRDVLLREARRTGGPTIENSRWHCAMILRARHEGTRRWSKLDGGHRAVDDCLATRDLLLKML